MKKNTKYLKIYVKDENIKIEEEKDEILKEFGCNFENLGISIINNYKKSSYEIIYISIKGFEFCYIQSKFLKVYQSRIKYMNFDNTSSYFAFFPVILTPHKYSKFMFEKDKYLLNCCIQIDIKAETVNLYY